MTGYKSSQIALTEPNRPTSVVLNQVGVEKSIRSEADSTGDLSALTESCLQHIMEFAYDPVPQQQPATTDCQTIPTTCGAFNKAIRSSPLCALLQYAQTLLRFNATNEDTEKSVHALFSCTSVLWFEAKLHGFHVPVDSTTIPAGLRFDFHNYIIHSRVHFQTGYGPHCHLLKSLYLKATSPTSTHNFPHSEESIPGATPTYTTKRTTELYHSRCSCCSIFVSEELGWLTFHMLETDLGHIGVSWLAVDFQRASQEMKNIFEKVISTTSSCTTTTEEQPPPRDTECNGHPTRDNDSNCNSTHVNDHSTMNTKSPQTIHENMSHVTGCATNTASEPTSNGSESHHHEMPEAAKGLTTDENDDGSPLSTVVAGGVTETTPETTNHNTEADNVDPNTNTNERETNNGTDDPHSGQSKDVSDAENGLQQSTTTSSHQHTTDNNPKSEGSEVSENQQEHPQQQPHPQQEQQEQQPIGMVSQKHLIPVYWSHYSVTEITNNLYYDEEFFKLLSGLLQPRGSWRPHQTMVLLGTICSHDPSWFSTVSVNHPSFNGAEMDFFQRYTNPSVTLEATEKYMQLRSGGNCVCPQTDIDSLPRRNYKIQCAQCHPPPPHNPHNPHMQHSHHPTQPHLHPHQQHIHLPPSDVGQPHHHQQHQHHGHQQHHQHHLQHHHHHQPPPGYSYEMNIAEQVQQAQAEHIHNMNAQNPFATCFSSSPTNTAGSELHNWSSCIKGLLDRCMSTLDHTALGNNPTRQEVHYLPTTVLPPHMYWTPPQSDVRYYDNPSSSKIVLPPHHRTPRAPSPPLTPANPMWVKTSAVANPKAHPIMYPVHTEQATHTAPPQQLHKPPPPPKNSERGVAQPQQHTKTHAIVSNVHSPLPSNVDKPVTDSNSKTFSVTSTTGNTSTTNNGSGRLYEHGSGQIAVCRTSNSPSHPITNVLFGGMGSTTTPQPLKQSSPPDNPVNNDDRWSGIFSRRRPKAGTAPGASKDNQRPTKEADNLGQTTQRTSSNSGSSTGSSQECQNGQNGYKDPARVGGNSSNNSDVGSSDTTYTKKNNTDRGDKGNYNDHHNSNSVHNHKNEQNHHNNNNNNNQEGHLSATSWRSTWDSTTPLSQPTTGENVLPSNLRPFPSSGSTPHTHRRKNQDYGGRRFGGRENGRRFPDRDRDHDRDHDRDRNRDRDRDHTNNVKQRQPDNWRVEATNAGAKKWVMAHN